jgi:hypothetical protein
MRALLIALAILNFSGSSFASGPSLDVIGTEAFSLYPTVTTDLTFESERSQLGWGSFDLTAVPEVDEIRVDLVIGVPAAEIAWRSCKRLEFVGEHSRVVRSADWAGVPMTHGVYDSLRGRLTIEDVRSLARDETSFADVCGEHVRFDAEARQSMLRFVETFDELALTTGESAPSPPLELGPDHDFFPETPVHFPFPA